MTKEARRPSVGKEGIGCEWTHPKCEKLGKLIGRPEKAPGLPHTQVHIIPGEQRDSLWLGTCTLLVHSPVLVLAAMWPMASGWEPLFLSLLPTWWCSWWRICVLYLPGARDRVAWQPHGRWLCRLHTTHWRPPNELLPINVFSLDFSVFFQTQCMQFTLSLLPCLLLPNAFHRVHSTPVKGSRVLFGSCRHLRSGPLSHTLFSNTRADNFSLPFPGSPSSCKLFEICIFSSFNEKNLQIHVIEYNDRLMMRHIYLVWFSIQMFIAFLNLCLVTLCDLWFVYSWSKWLGVIGQVGTSTSAKIQVTNGTGR